MCIKIRIKNKTSSMTLKRNGKVYTRKLPIQWSVVLFMDSGEGRHRQNRGLQTSRNVQFPSHPNGGGVRKPDPYRAAMLGEVNLGQVTPIIASPPGHKLRNFCMFSGDKKWVIIKGPSAQQDCHEPEVTTQTCNRKYHPHLSSASSVVIKNSIPAVLSSH